MAPSVWLPSRRNSRAQCCSCCALAQQSPPCCMCCAACGTVSTVLSASCPVLRHDMLCCAVQGQAREGSGARPPLAGQHPGHSADMVGTKGPGVCSLLHRLPLHQVRAALPSPSGLSLMKGCFQSVQVRAVAQESTSTAMSCCQHCMYSRSLPHLSCLLPHSCSFSLDLPPPPAHSPLSHKNTEVYIFILIYF